MNQTGLFLVLGIAIALFPAFYYGYKKNIIVIFSEKYNILPIQLIFTIPLSLGFSFTLSIILYSLLTFLIPSFVELMVNYFGQFIGLILPIISDILIILVCNRYIVHEKKEPVPTTNELLIYFPIQTYHNFGGKIHGTKYSYPKKARGDLLNGVQESNLVINPKELNEIDFAFTFSGEIVINEKSLEILNDHKLTGFQVCPIHDLNNNQINGYFQM